MAKIRIIKKNNDCSMEYEVGDICEVTGTWYGGVHINGCHRDQCGQIICIVAVSQTDPIDSDLRGASELGDSATDLHNIAFICRGDGTRIVPYFYFNGAGSIRQRSTQKRLASSGRLGICSFQNIEALHLIRKGHLCDQFVVFHIAYFSFSSSVPTTSLP